VAKSIPGAHRSKVARYRAGIDINHPDSLSW